MFQNERFVWDLMHGEHMENGNVHVRIPHNEPILSVGPDPIPYIVSTSYMKLSIVVLLFLYTLIL